MGRTCAILAIVCGVVAAGACSSDSPTGPSPQAVAMHLDSVLSAHPSADGSWENALTLGLSSLVWGVAPTTVQISVNEAPTTFQAVAWDSYVSSAGVDSTIYLSAWSGGNDPAALRLDAIFYSGTVRALYVEYAPDPSHGSFIGSGTVDASLESLGGRCHPGVGADTSFASDCRLGRVEASFDIMSNQGANMIHLVMTPRLVDAMRNY